MSLYSSTTTGISLAGTDLSDFFSVSVYDPLPWYRIFNIKPPGAVGWFKTSDKYPFRNYYGRKGDMSRAWTPELRRRYMTLIQNTVNSDYSAHSLTTGTVTGDVGNRLQDFKTYVSYQNVGNAAIWTALANVPLDDAGTLGTMAVGTYYGNFLYNGTTNNIVTRQPGFAYTNFSDEATITLQPYVIYGHSDAARQHSFRLYRDGSVIQTQPGTLNAVTVDQTYNFSNITIAPNTTAYFRVDGSLLTGTGTDYLYLRQFGFNVVSFA